jgi:hypothetical protein
MSHFRYSWKRATIIPIPKPNKPPSDPSSYRPISLLSIVSKLFERIIANRLVTYVSQQRRLPNERFCFRKKHSTVSQLAHQQANVSWQTVPSSLTLPCPEMQQISSQQTSHMRGVVPQTYHMQLPKSNPPREDYKPPQRQS